MEGIGKEATEERLEILFRDSHEFNAGLNASDSIDEDEKTRPIEWNQPAHAMDSGAFSNIVRIDGGEALQPKRVEILDRARSIRSSVSSDDADDIDRLLRLIETAELAKDQELLDGLEAELEDLLFYLT